MVCAIHAESVDREALEKKVGFILGRERPGIAGLVAPSASGEPEIPLDGPVERRSERQTERAVKPDLDTHAVAGLRWVGILDSDDPSDAGPSALYVRQRD